MHIKVPAPCRARILEHHSMHRVPLRMPDLPALILLYSFILIFLIIYSYQFYTGVLHEVNIVSPPRHNLSSFPFSVLQSPHQFFAVFIDCREHASNNNDLLCLIYIYIYIISQISRPKLVPMRIEPKTLRVAYPKIRNQYHQTNPIENLI